jgi:CysZ protein
VAVGLGVLLSGLGVWGVARLVATLVPGEGASFLGRAALDVVFGAGTVFAAVVLAIAVAQPLTRVALDRIARPLEDLGDAHAPSLRAPSGLVASVGVALSTLGVTLPTVGVLELVTLVAPEGAVVTEPLAFAVSALGLAWELLDHPFSRRGLGFGERLRWIKESFFAVLGFAIAAQVFLLIPGVDLFLLPVGIAGATRLVTSPRAALPRRPASTPGG